MLAAAAAHLYKIDADQGDSSAQSSYGFCLQKGKGVPINQSTAASYFKLSADQGNRSAQFNYGLCLYKGEGQQYHHFLIGLMDH
jgi:TPR repeat protein